MYFLGEFTLARKHVEQALTLYDPQQHNPYASKFPLDPGVVCLAVLAWILWYQGYPEQALKKKTEAFTLAKELSHPLSLAWALNVAAKLHLWRREAPAVLEQTKAMLQLADEHGMPYWLTEGAMMQGWALAEQGQVQEGITQMRQGLADWRAMGSGVAASYFLSLPVEAYGKGGQLEEGLTILVEALAIIHKTGEGNSEAEIYRLKGELTLQESKVESHRSQVQSQKPVLSDAEGSQGEKEAEACFHKALEVARKQQAKSWELRTATSLARLWQKQGKKEEAHDLLAPVYEWFTEGFDTRDLQEAKTLLDELY